MTTYELRKHCGQCDGDGKVTLWLNDVEQGEADCPQCGGSGLRLDGTIETSIFADILQKCEDIINKCEALEEKCQEILDEVTP